MGFFDGIGKLFNSDLIPNCPGPGFCLFLMFGHAIVIRVLMLNF